MWEVVGIVVCKLMATGAGVVNDIRCAGLTREYRKPPAGQYVNGHLCILLPVLKTDYARTGGITQVYRPASAIRPTAGRRLPVGV